MDEMVLLLILSIALSCYRNIKINDLWNIPLLFN